MPDLVNPLQPSIGREVGCGLFPPGLTLLSAGAVWLPWKWSVGRAGTPALTGRWKWP